MKTQDFLEHQHCTEMLSKDFFRIIEKNNRRQKLLKKRLSVILLLFISVVSYSQNFELKETKKSIKDTVITIDSLEFNININSSGNYFQVRTSKKTGNEYRYYIGYKTDFFYLEKEVFTNSKQDKFYFLSVNKNGNLSKRELVKK